MEAVPSGCRKRGKVWQPLQSQKFDKRSVNLGSTLNRERVAPGGGEHGIDAVAVAAFQVIVAHAVLGLVVAEDRLDRGTAFHLKSVSV